MTFQKLVGLIQPHSNSKNAKKPNRARRNPSHRPKMFRIYGDIFELGLLRSITRKPQGPKKLEIVQKVASFSPLNSHQSASFSPIPTAKLPKKANRAHRSLSHSPKMFRIYGNIFLLGLFRSITRKPQGPKIWELSRKLLLGPL